MATRRRRIRKSAPSKRAETPIPEEPGRVALADEVSSAFVEYAMSVIVSRALPDARDGLKPVHRRILWSMHEQGFRPDRPHVKCARVVGDTMARFHPHGDSSIYEALARMAQPFSLLHPLIDFHGNYGSPEDPPAAARYTECRLDATAMLMLADIGEDTVDFVDNYSGDFEEPGVLPGRIPNLLVNGSQGIAVGMATNIPPHNLADVTKAALALLDDPEIIPSKLAQIVKAPDFPTGGVIVGKKGVRDAYKTGRGRITLRAVVSHEQEGRRRNLVVTELPYQVSAEQVAKRIATMVDAGELDGISAVNDESSGDDTRFVVTVKRGADPDLVLNNLWKHTPLETRFAVNMVALVGGVPRTLTLKDALAAFISHQRDVTTRRCECRLRAAQERLHILEGLLVAVGNIDAVIAAIRASSDRAAAREALQAPPFSVSEVQADHILDMPLNRLTRLGTSNLEEESEQKRAEVAYLESVLSDDSLLRAMIREEMEAARDAHASPRRTKMEDAAEVIEPEDLIEDVDLVFTLSAAGYAKVVPASKFRAASGSPPAASAGVRDDDSLVSVIRTSTHSPLTFVSSLGRAYRLRGHQIPVAQHGARGTTMGNLLPLREGERISGVLGAEDEFMMFATASGRVKRSATAEFESAVRPSGIIATQIQDGDRLVSVSAVPADGDVVLVTERGMCLRFNSSEVRAMGRTAAGVVGMKLKHENDSVVACLPLLDGSHLLVVTAAGAGKRVPVASLPSKHRGGVGYAAVLLKGGDLVAGAAIVCPDDHVVTASASGEMLHASAASATSQAKGKAAGAPSSFVPVGRGDKIVSVAVASNSDAP